jgi:hypothetical protein
MKTFKPGVSMDQALEARTEREERTVNRSPLEDTFLKNNRDPIRRIQMEIEAMDLPASSVAIILGLPDGLWARQEPLFPPNQTKEAQ